MHEYENTVLSNYIILFFRLKLPAGRFRCVCCLFCFDSEPHKKFETPTDRDVPNRSGRPQPIARGSVVYKIQNRQTWPVTLTLIIRASDPSFIRKRLQGVWVQAPHHKCYSYDNTSLCFIQLPHDHFAPQITTERDVGVRVWLWRCMASSTTTTPTVWYTATV